MSDIVKELRRLESCVVSGKSYGFEQSVWTEAADEVELLRGLLRWTRKYVPAHDSYFHNPYIGEHERCEVCKKRAEVDAALAAREAK